ncbi:MAG: glutaredoxin family protein [Halioglobus sp.]
MLILYGTSACHLCELAAALLKTADLEFEEVDISESDALFERYGVTIPVLKRQDGVELNWPFDAASVRTFVD